MTMRDHLLENIEIGKPLPPAVRSAVRVSYALRRVPASRWHALLPRREPPQVGDVALARVESIGKNMALDLASGRRCKLHNGDLIGVVFGNRYATLQFEGYARSDGDRCDLLSGGGLCGQVASKHDTMPEPTRLRIAGALGDETGQPLRLQHFTVRERGSDGLKRPRIAVVLGTSMDSGKTHTALSVIQGLERRGVAVAGIKLTGTAAGTDTLAMLDAGAGLALDFVDGGLPSPYPRPLAELLGPYRLLADHAAAQGAEWAVVEIADGVIQGETAALLASTRFVSSVDAWLLAANDALGALGAVGLLRPKGVVPLAISGMVSRSALARREVEAATQIPCVAAAELQAGVLNAKLLAAAPPRGLRAVSGEYAAIAAAE